MSCRRRMWIVMRPSRTEVGATQRTIPHLDMLRCGISNRPMSARGQNPNLPHRNSSGRFASMSGHAAASSRPRSGARSAAWCSARACQITRSARCDRRVARCLLACIPIVGRCANYEKYSDHQGDRDARKGTPSFWIHDNSLIAPNYYYGSSRNRSISKNGKFVTAVTAAAIVHPYNIRVDLD
jgi:hypothetical protein